MDSVRVFIEQLTRNIFLRLAEKKIAPNQFVQISAPSSRLINLDFSAYLYNSLAGSVSDEKINATVAVGDD
jgi:hypothetical protein